MPQDPSLTSSASSSGRREIILDAAMQAFAAFGYRRTSMDDVARAARVSRPGLYFLFDSKPALFREAVTRAIGRDLEAVAQVLAEDSPLRDRLRAAFDRWAGSYVGPLTGQEAGAHDFDPALLGSVLETAPGRFQELLTAAISEVYPNDAADRARTLVSASIGIKHQVQTQVQYSAAIQIAIDLITLPPARG
jgi:AcrR family transcriptional regulator